MRLRSVQDDFCPFHMSLLLIRDTLPTECSDLISWNESLRSLLDCNLTLIYITELMMK